MGVFVNEVTRADWRLDMCVNEATREQIDGRYVPKWINTRADWRLDMCVNEETREEIDG